MKKYGLFKVYGAIASILTLIALTVAGSASWFSFYQSREPKYLRK